MVPFGKYFIQRTSGFLYPYILIVIAAAVALAINEKGSEVLFLNQYSNAWLDRFFLTATDLGLGSFFAIFATALLIYNYRWSLILFVSLSWVGILTYTFKQLVFTSATRPFHYFYYADFPRFLHDVPLIYYHSFPSGHTMSIFAFCITLTYLMGKKWAGAILLLLAITVGISRIYLLQHFGTDVLAGSGLGLAAAFLSTFIMDKLVRLSNRSKFNRGLWNLLVKRAD